MVDLKPCPICSAAPKLTVRGKAAGYQCRGKTHLLWAYGTTAFEAAENWNARDPEAASEIERLREALAEARDAIASLEEDALGMAKVHPGSDGDDGYAYPIRDELLAKIDEALSAYIMKEVGDGD